MAARSAALPPALFAALVGAPTAAASLWWAWSASAGDGGDGGGGGAGAGAAAAHAATVSLVGRREELAALGALSATAGWAPVWMVRGVQGVGKSRLLSDHAVHERGCGRTVVELSLRPSGDGKSPSAPAVAAELARGLGLAGAAAASFGDIATQLDERARAASAEPETGADQPALLPLVIADDVPVDSSGACTTQAGVALAEWGCAAAAAAQVRVVIVPATSLPSFRDARPSVEDGGPVRQMRMLWLDLLPAEESREFARALHAAGGDDDAAAAESEAPLEPEPEVLPEEVHMAAASGLPAEMVALLGAAAGQPQVATGEDDATGPSTLERAILEREQEILDLVGVHAGLLDTDDTGASSAAACWAVSAWGMLAAMAGLTADGSDGETLGATPHEMLQKWGMKGEGPAGYRRGGGLQWGEVCARLLGGLGMEAVVRQTLGIPVLCDDAERAAIAEDCAEFIRRGVLGIRPDGGLGATEWEPAVTAAAAGVEYGRGGGRIGDEFWNGAMGAVTNEAVKRLHEQLAAARDAALPPGGFVTDDAGGLDAEGWTDGVQRLEMAVLASLQLRQLVEVDEWQRTIDELALKNDTESYERAQAELERLGAKIGGGPVPPKVLGLMIDVDTMRQRVRLSVSLSACMPCASGTLGCFSVGLAHCSLCPAQLDVTEREMRGRSRRLAAELAECAARERALAAALKQQLLAK